VQGHGDAQYSLGHLIQAKGMGLQLNYDSARYWYTLSAEQGFASAQFGLGFMFANGLGVPQSYETAVKWFTLAAEQGLDVAQSALESM
jgi:TPR repeat protein